MRCSRRPLAGLIALNAALLAALGAVTFAPKLQAQSRARSTYTMSAATIKGQNQPVVFIVDEGAAELVGVSWDEQAKSLAGMGYRNLTADANDIARTRN